MQGKRQVLYKGKHKSRNEKRKKVAEMNRREYN